MRRTRASLAAVVVALLGAMPLAAVAAEPGVGFPFRGAKAHCVAVDSQSRSEVPRHARGDFRWFVKTLAHYSGREDGCRAEQVNRYGQADTWRVRLACPTGTNHEDWTLNYDGSITANRDGWKTTFRPCEPGLGR